MARGGTWLAIALAAAAAGTLATGPADATARGKVLAKPTAKLATAAPTPRPQAPGPLAPSAFRWLDDADAMMSAVGEAAPDFTFMVAGEERYGWRLADGALIVAEPLGPGDTRFYFFAPDMVAPFLVRDRVWSFGYDRGALAALYREGGVLTAWRAGDWTERMATELYGGGRRLWFASQLPEQPASRQTARASSIVVDLHFDFGGWRESEGWRSYRRGQTAGRRRERAERFERERADRRARARAGGAETAIAEVPSERGGSLSTGETPARRARGERPAERLRALPVAEAGISPERPSVGERRAVRAARRSAAASVDPGLSAPASTPATAEPGEPGRRRLRQDAEPVAVAARPDLRERGNRPRRDEVAASIPPEMAPVEPVAPAVPLASPLVEPTPAPTAPPPPASEPAPPPAPVALPTPEPAAAPAPASPEAAPPAESSQSQLKKDSERMYDREPPAS